MTTIQTPIQCEKYTDALVLRSPGTLRQQRDVATSSTMFMRIVGQSIGAAVFGAILNFGVYRLLPDVGDAVNRLMSPTARQSLGASEIGRLTEAVGSSLHVVYVIAGLVAVISLMLALALPARLSPTSPRRVDAS